ncbi:MAG: SCP2 sterol-binding domain-containing protein [Melioribacteraceae bacterium]|nr:SCP2 sterol-binding domain-containing protein [Melioribacteraceae bacterium]
MIAKKAEGMKFTINLITPDNDEKYVIEMSNATLTNIKGFQSENPDLTITMNRSDLDYVMMGVKTLDELIKTGVVKTKGNVKIIAQLKSALDYFEMGFEILPGTASKMVEKKTNPFQQDEPAVWGAE